MTRAYKDTGVVYRVHFTRHWDYGYVEHWTQGPYATLGAARGQASYESGRTKSSRGSYEVTAVIEESFTDWHTVE